ncbi:ribosomal protein S18-alanine N-acetyltransferase [Isoptericola sp. b441]|uniref:Ribosomal protein S18-alanine N-acetyltransferase n=1 Tax=Actinotalea lenta TaxID=3064654 RepID=A0ABT9D9N5_9CELL|nr:ribosomal protein S18-alanine N-acetyltransferase [Isoptericola sp. b441]MDO8105672.1 ribosomal protein S18-alanine N-acetyltransferase [Isoptericola sp. b441]
MADELAPGPAGEPTAGAPLAPASGAVPVVRPLTPADVPAVAALERELFERSAWPEVMIREELDAFGRYYVGIDDEAGLAAYAGSWFDGDVSQVMTLAVSTRAQHRGWGRALLRTLLDRARSDRAQALFLEVRVDNEPAIALYRSEGFEILTRRRRYYQPEDVDAWTMRLEL